MPEPEKISKNEISDQQNLYADRESQGLAASASWISLPSGTVTFLFTDIEGSVGMWERNPQAMEAAMQQHNALLGQAITAHQGIAFKCTGDGFVAAFPAASKTLLAAIQAQRALASAEWNELGPLKVRMGLHTGEAEPDPQLSDYFSPSTNRAQRVMSAGHGGQVLLSQESADLCSRNLPEEVFLKDLGLHRLKGLPQPERIYQAVAPGLETEFPLLNTLDRFPNNLPVQLTSFIGREKESEEVLRLLQTTRLLTLSGVGGTGKTRLALHVASQALEQFEDGIWLVELAPITDPALFLPTTAAVFGYYEEQFLENRLFLHLKERSLLLILDNCEHLIQEAARFTNRLLQAAPHVKVLATSREALELPGETIYHTPSLDFPGTKAGAVQQYDLAELVGCDAVRLFIGRARAVLPSFLLTEDNANQVLQICQRLDGIPLAIELAAARLQVFSIEQILEKLESSFRFLTRGDRVTTPRQQTLRATIDWSYNLLSESEKALLRRLSVFVGGFDLSAAEAVCACASQDEEVFELLGNLVKKSLVEVDRNQAEQRYRLIETVKQYAKERLNEAGEEIQIHQRHLEHFARVAEEFDDSLKLPKNTFRVYKIKLDLDNFRAALSWAYGHGNSEQAALGLNLACCLSFLWHFCNLNVEGLNWLKKGLGVLDDDDRWLHARAKGLCYAGWHSSFADRDDESPGFARQSECLYRRLDEPLYHALTKILVASVCVNPKLADHLKCTRTEAYALISEGERVIREVGDKIKLFNVLEAKLYLEEDNAFFEDFVYEMEREAQGSLFEGAEHWWWAEYASKKGELVASRVHWEKALSYGKKFDFKICITWPLISLADLAKMSGDIDLAQVYYEQALATSLEIGMMNAIGRAVTNLVTIYLNKGEYPRVSKVLQAGLPFLPEMDFTTLVFHYVVSLVEAAESLIQSKTTPILLGFVVANRNASYNYEGYHKARIDKIIFAAKSRLGETDFEAKFTAGEKMTRQQAIAEARFLANELNENQAAR